MNNTQKIKSALTVSFPQATQITTEGGSNDANVLAFITLGGTCPALGIYDLADAQSIAGAKNVEIVNFVGNRDGSIFASVIFGF